MEAQQAGGAGTRARDVVKPTKTAGIDSKIRGLVLAAGRGSRLGSAGHAVPKCLLEVGRRALIDHQLDALADAGVGPTALVIGYAADEVREAVGYRAEYVVNTRWSRTNSLYSFWLAREWLATPVVILNSDVLFSPEILDRLLETEGDAIAIDTGSGTAREQMKVSAANGRLLDMRKDLSADDVAGENVGILKLTAETAQAVLEEAERLIESGEEQSWLGAAVREVARTRDITVVDVADLPWVEIDFPTDLDRARKEVWPQIQRGARKRSSRLRLALLLMGLPLLAGAPWFVAHSVADPVEPVWETLEVEVATPTAVLSGGVGKPWWLLEPGEQARIKVRGPGPVRVDTRLADPVGERSPYVLELTLDGEPLDWELLHTRPSSTATHPEFVVGRRERVKLEVPTGTHDLSVRVVAPEGRRCLLRVREVESDLDD